MRRKVRKRVLRKRTSKNKNFLRYGLISAISVFIILLIAAFSFYSNYEFSENRVTGKNLLQIINSLVVSPPIPIAVDLDSSSDDYRTKRKLNPDSTTGISEIVLDVNGIYKTDLEIESSEEKPEVISEEVPTLAYKYLKIDAIATDGGTSAADLVNNLDAAVLKLKVKSDWIEENDLGERDVSFFKYKSPEGESLGEWVELRTDFIRSTRTNERDADYENYYETEISSFGYYFAIAEKTGDFDSSVYLPTIEFVEENEETGILVEKTTASGSYIDVTSIDALILAGMDGFYGKLDTVTISLYNSTGFFLDSSSGRSSPPLKNFADLNRPYYSYHLNATANNTYGDKVATETKVIVLQNPFNKTVFSNLILTGGTFPVLALPLPSADENIVDKPKEIGGFSKITLDVTKAVSGQSLTVKAYNPLPVAIPEDAFLNPYSYLKFEPSSDLRDALDEDAVLEFVVGDRWLTDRGLTKDSISLFKYQESETEDEEREWVELPTSYKSFTGTATAPSEHLYEASIDLIGYFAIADKTLLTELNNPPKVEFLPDTTSEGNYDDKSEIIANVRAEKTVRDIVNITVYLYNENNLVSKITKNSNLFYNNFSGLSDGTYYLSVTTSDGISLGKTPTRKIVLQTPETKEKISIPKIDKGKASEYIPDDSDIGIKTINLSAKNDIVNAEMTIKTYDDKPVSIEEEKSGEVYQYLEFETSNINPNLNEAIVEIQIEKDWVEDNDLNKEKISLFKYDESEDEWIEISTTYKDADNVYYNYIAKLNSFSYFAIAEKTSSANATSANSSQANSSSVNNSQSSSSAANQGTSGTSTRTQDTSSSRSSPTEISKTSRESFFKENSSTIIFSVIAFGLIVFIATVGFFFFKIIKRAKKDLGRFEKMEKTAEKDLHKLEKVEKEAEKDLHRFERKFSWL